MSDILDDIWAVLIAVVSLVMIGIVLAICGVAATGCRGTLARWTGIDQPYTESAR